MLQDISPVSLGKLSDDLQFSPPFTEDYKTTSTEPKLGEDQRQKTQREPFFFKEIPCLKVLYKFEIM
jgi:hypothetical protein